MGADALWFTFAILIIGFTMIAIRSSFWLLKFFDGLMWWGMAFFWTSNPPALAAAGTPVHTIFTILFIFIGIGIMFMGGGQGYTKETNGEKVEGFRFQVPKFLRGDNEDEYGNNTTRQVSRQERMNNYSSRVNRLIGDNYKRKR